MLTDHELTFIKTDASCCASAEVSLLPADTATRLADALKALGHPVRLQIMYLLSRQGGQVCVCDIEGQFDLKQPTISHHLRVLREVGLIDGEQRGLYMFYRVVPETLSPLVRILRDVTP